MNTHERDELEAELAELRPHEPSQPLRQRIADSLMVAQSSRWNQTWDSLLRAAIVAGGLIAASVVIMLGRGDVGDSAPAVDSDISNAVVLSALDQQVPSWWVYRQASLRSTSEFNALLEKHARGSRISISEPTPSSLFSLINHELNSPSGEL